jgi:hypothetical protein
MASGKQVALWVILVGIIGSLVLYFTAERPRVVQKPLATPQLVEAETSGAASAVVEASGPSSSLLPNVMSSRPRLTIASAAVLTERPQCSSADECRGPKHAECIEVKCLQGRCVYDEGHCECVSAEDCDDGNPCTRNHCFSSTKKCIFIPIDECK